MPFHGPDQVKAIFEEEPLAQQPTAIQLHRFPERRGGPSSARSRIGANGTRELPVLQNNAPS